MSKLTNEIKFQVTYYYRNVSSAVKYYLKNLGYALVGRNILGTVNEELRSVLTTFAEENYKLSIELGKLTKPKKTTKKKDN